jgi:hypothetical protein
MAIAPANGHIFQTLDEAVPVGNINSGSTQRYFLGVKGQLLPGPEAFLARSAEGHETDSHFHRIDQFQIMFGAPGAYYQRSPLPCALLHYTDAYSVYGPFGAGPDAPMSFFTLRGTPSDIHASMPKDREHLLYRGDRHHQINLEPLLSDPAPLDGATSLDILVPEEPDGLAAYLMRIGPGAAQVAPPKGELRTGRYTIVLEGELVCEGRSFGPKSVGWSTGETSEILFGAGPMGAAVALLHMPFPATPSVRLAVG